MDGNGRENLPVPAAGNGGPPGDGPRLPEEAVRELERAAGLLAHPSFLVTVAAHVGVPIEALTRKLPSKARGLVSDAVRAALEKAANLAIRSLGDGRGWLRGGDRHRLAVALTGLVGGAAGFTTLAVELPVTTTLILRSIAEIAREEGEDLSTPEARLACLEVFALGGRSKADDPAESAYFAIRAALAKSLNAFLERAGSEGAGRALGGFLARIAARFEVAVGEKAVAQAAPVLGAIGGATINLLFISHFQRMARGHFIVRRLERLHGQEPVREELERLFRQLGA